MVGVFVYCGLNTAMLPYEAAAPACASLTRLARESPWLVPSRGRRGGLIAVVVVADERLGFAGHETFPFRHGWLKKAVDALRQDPRALGNERAIVTLGVGKNMVDSIRHWGLATQVLIDGGQRMLGPSPLGLSLLADGGWDPYLEDPASVWLLHWLLVTNPARAAVWSFAFGHYPHPEFTREDLTEKATRFAEARGAGAKPSTVSRDVDCLVRSYVAASGGFRGAPEDAFDCPLSELDLIRGERDGEIYRFAVGPKRSLPAAVVGFALLQFAARFAPGRQTLRVGDCVYRPGSPGQVFRLDENSFVDYVEALASLTSHAIQFDDTSGLRQVYLREPVPPTTLLQRQYQNEG